MFQNITADIDQDYKEKKSIKDIIKDCLTKKNIILYIISFLISMVGFSTEIYPFGLAITAAACALSIPIGGIVVITTIGTLIKFGPLEMISYIMTLIVFITSVMIMKPKISIDDSENEKQKLAKYIFFSCIIVQAVKLISTEILVYNILQLFMFAIVTTIFYKIFVNSIGVIKYIGIKRVFSVEELIGISLTIAIAITSLSGLQVFGMSISNILCILLVLILGWTNGVLVGGTAGITIGVVLGIIGVNDPILIASYALSGMLAGLLNRLGKVGVIVGFIIGNAILTYVTNGNTEALIHLREIFIASIGLLLVPKTVEISIDDLVGRKQFLPKTKEKMLAAHKETVHKLNSMSETITEIANIYHIENKNLSEFEKEQEETYKEELINNISNLSENILYEDIINEDNHILDDIYAELIKKEEIDLEDLIEIFAKHNNYIIGIEENIELKTDVLAILKAINYTYRINKLNYIWKQKMNESRKNVSKELNGVSKVISTIANEIEEPSENIKKKEEEIRDILAKRGLPIIEVSMKITDSGKHIVELYMEENVNNDSIAKLLAKMIGQEMVSHRGKRLEDNTILKIYETKDIYTAKVGVAKIAKNNGKISGDKHLITKLQDGKTLLAISDGMGSGREAQKSSKMAITMLEKLLQEGFDKDTSLSLINSTMILNSNEDMYATLDISILDLFKGKIECVKNGACPTLIKRNNTIEEISSNEIPAGILSNIDLVVYEKQLEPGDLIIMCSDGITDYKENDHWLQDTLKQINTDDVQRIADLILTEAIDAELGVPKDDKTIIVARIENNLL